MDAKKLILDSLVTLDVFQLVRVARRGPTGKQGESGGTTQQRKRLWITGWSQNQVVTGSYVGSSLYQYDPSNLCIVFSSILYIISSCNKEFPWCGPNKLDLYQCVSAIQDTTLQLSTIHDMYKIIISCNITN